MVWVRCDGCEDYWCTRHEAHTADCECPEIQDWDTDPYDHHTRSRARIWRTGR